MIKEPFEARGWDYVQEISLAFLNFDETNLARKFCPAFLCHKRYHCSEC